MRGLGWMSIVVLGAGCPRVARLSYHFDLASGHGTLVAQGIGTDDPASAEADFAKIVDEYLLGDALTRDHPTWRIGERHLVERDGQLFGIVEFGFSHPADAGLYQHDRKSNFLWCAGPGEEIVATSGEVIPPYPHCVAFDRKARVIDVTVGDDSPMESLLPQFRAWDGAAIASDDPVESLFGSTPTPPTLSSLLPAVPVAAAWTSLGLPVAGGSVVYTNDAALQVSHVGTASTVLPKYEAALTAAGFARVSETSDSSRWTRGEEALSLSATEAGNTVIVSVAR